MGPTLVRLAWHSSGTYDKHSKTGGSDGATMRFDGAGEEANHGANAGLGVARDFLEPIKAKFPGISYSDLWIYASYVAIEEMGGPEIPFVAGRKDAASGKECPPEGRLPNGQAGEGNADSETSIVATAAHVRQVGTKNIAARPACCLQF
eukprot:SAG22_NODE_2363_length_2655_cov_2.789906_2_plen_149_part_00